MKLWVTAVVVVVLLFAAPVCPATQTQEAVGPEKTVNTFLTALSNADLEGIVATFAEDATAFLPVASVPKRVTGRREIREAFAPFVESIRSSGKGPPYMRLNPLQMSVQDLGTTAIVTFHLGKLPSEVSGQATSFSRRSFVLKLIGTQWFIVHMHGSNLLLQPESKH